MNRVRATWMIALLLLFGSALTLGPSTQAQAVCPGLTKASYTAFDTETITVSNTAVGFTEATFRPGTDSRQWAQFAAFSTEGDDLRYWPDGTAPTSASGHLITADSSGVVCGVDALPDFLMIRVTGDVTVRVSYYR